MMALSFRGCVKMPAPWTLLKRLSPSHGTTKTGDMGVPLLCKMCVASWSIRTSSTSGRLTGGIQGLRTIFLRKVPQVPTAQTTSRQFCIFSWRGVKQPQRSWEVDNSAVKNDTLIYSYKNDRYFKMITIFGIVQLLFWGNLALFSYSGLSNVQEQTLQGKLEENSFWGKILGYQVKYKYRLAVFCMLVGYAVMFFTWVYPQRSIRRLILLAGGQNLKVTTYTHLGKTREFVVPLANLSSNQTRDIKKPTMSLKIKGHWFYFLLDINNGTFHQPHLFDNVVNLKRNLK